MKRQCAYRLRLYPNKEQETMLRKSCGCRRWIYNWGLEQKIQSYEKGTSLSYSDLCSMLPSIKSEFPWLKEVDSTSLQQGLKDLNQAYKNFFKRVQKKKKPGFPKFKSRHHRQSFRVQMSLKIDPDDRRIKIGKLGWFRFRGQSPLVDKIQKITVSLNSDSHWYASVLVEEEIQPLPKTGNVRGYDLGLSAFLVGAGGLKVDSPKSTKNYARKLKRAQQKLSRRKKGSRNREKVRKKVAKVHHKIKSIRKDFHHKLSRRLTDTNDVIILEDLNVKGLARTKLAKSVHDAGWSQFIEFLKYKCEWYGRELVHVDRFFPSTRICHVCGTKANLSLSDREWVCGHCDITHDRDINAARNLTLWGRAYVNGQDMTPDEYQQHRQERFSRVGTTRFQAYGDCVRPSSFLGTGQRSMK